MKRLVFLITTLAAGVALVVAKRFGSFGPSVDLASRLEAMPDTAPPKWIYNQVTAIRANTDRTVELLERRAAAESQEQAPGPAE